MLSQIPADPGIFQLLIHSIYCAWKPWVDGRNKESKETRKNRRKTPKIHLVLKENSSSCQLFSVDLNYAEALVL